MYSIGGVTRKPNSVSAFRPQPLYRLATGGGMAAIYLATAVADCL